MRVKLLYICVTSWALFESEARGENIESDRVFALELYATLVNYIFISSVKAKMIKTLNVKSLNLELLFNSETNAYK